MKDRGGMYLTLPELIARKDRRERGDYLTLSELVERQAIKQAFEQNPAAARRHFGQALKRYVACVIVLAWLGGCSTMESLTPPSPHTVDQGIASAKASLTLAYSRLAVAVERQLIDVNQATKVQDALDMAAEGVVSSEQLLTQGAPLDAEHALQKAMEALGIANALLASFS